jgi:molybdopterin molybdotransferase
MTGAVLPQGADTVVPVERLHVDGDTAAIDPAATVSPGQFIHRRGSDRFANDIVIEAGTTLGPAEVAVLASSGYGRVEVARRAHVAVVSTGDELVGTDEPVTDFQIRSSNDFAIAAALDKHSLAETGRHRLRDDEQSLIDTIGRLHDENDVLILSGGVSMGQFDFVPGVLEALGCEVVFHRIEQKPGRPMWFGVSRDGKPVFALPGNPVSTLLCTTRYVVPALRAAAGAKLSPPLCYALDRAVSAPRHLSYFVPIVLVAADGPATVASPRPTNTSGDFATLAGTDGFLELAPGSIEHAAGTVGRYYPW